MHMAPSIDNVWIKYGEPRLYDNGEIDLITKTWSKSVDHENDQGQVTHAQLPMCGPIVMSMCFRVMVKLT
jgi:hypothetical protein